jgi:predicted transcriptional regulator YdeE
MQDLDDATSLLELEIQGQDVIKEWQSLLGQSNQSIANSANNNINIGLNNNQNAESGCVYLLLRN